jgi:transcription termination/antitermination protein NusG
VIPEETLHVLEARAGIRSDLLKSRSLSTASDSAASEPPRFWYALHTRSRYEKVVDRLLCERGFETFLPLATKRSNISSTRFREAQIPLFPGYTFVRFSPFVEDLRALRATTGVASIIGNRSGPVPIPEIEINSLKTLMAHDVSFSLSSLFMVGQRVIVARGPLMGVRGELLRRKSRQVFVVKIRLIQRSLEVDLSSRDLEAVTAMDENDFCSKVYLRK